MHKLSPPPPIVAHDVICGQSSRCDSRQSCLLPNVRAMECNSEKVWLSVLPISNHGFALHAFHVAMCLSYVPLATPRPPSHCVCSGSCNTDHTLTWPTSVSHNQLRDFIANQLLSQCVHPYWRTAIPCHCMRGLTSDCIVQLIRAYSSADNSFCCSERRGKRRR